MAKQDPKGDEKPQGGEKPPQGDNPQPQAGDGKSDAKQDPKGDEGQAQAGIPSVRVLCTRPNAGAVINGRLFVDVVIDDAKLHVSELMPLSEAESLTRISGYSLWSEDATTGPLVEAALEEARRSSTPESGGTGSIVEGDLRRQLEEHQATNLSLSKKLRDTSERADRLTEENTRLKTENEQLRTAAGVKAS